MTRAERGRRLYHTPGNDYGLLVVALLVIGLSIVMRVENGERVRIAGFPQLPELCQLKANFGISCPGCGMTRSFISVGHLDFVAAWHYNPVGVFFYAIVAFQIPFRVGQLVRHRRGLPPWELGPVVGWLWAILLTAAFVQWLLR